MQGRRLHLSWDFNYSYIFFNDFNFIVVSNPSPRRHVAVLRLKTAKESILCDINFYDAEQEYMNISSQPYTIIKLDFTTLASREIRKLHLLLIKLNHALPTTEFI